MDLLAIEAGLLAAAKNAVGVRPFPRMDAITPSSSGCAFCVAQGDGTYNQTFANGSFGMVEQLHECGIYVQRGEDDRKALLSFLAPSGATSIPQAIQADRTLGGACRTLVVKNYTGLYRLYTIGSTEYLGVVLNVRVWSTT